MQFYKSRGLRFGVLEMYLTTQERLKKMEVSRQAIMELHPT
jgi:hypothetical protein